MKRIVVTTVAALLAQLLALTLVVMTTGWADDADSMRIHFIVGFAFIGLCVGAASAWFAPSAASATAVAATILIVMHVPDIPDNVVEGVVQLIVSLISAAVPMVLIMKRRSGNEQSEAAL